MFETEMYRFLWNSKTRKIKKNTVIQDYKYGGLKMIDYTDFISALKIKLDQKTYSLKRKLDEICTEYDLIGYNIYSAIII
jgi:hypothetical protein